MPPTARSIKQQQRELTARLRAQGRTWTEIAAEFHDQYDVNARVALRMARGWSQREAADEWNKRWPDDPKTFKNFSYWEQWPAPTGHAPSLEVLGRLAELYTCRIADLVTDCADFRDRDTAHRNLRHLAELPSAIAGTGNSPHELLARLDEMDVHELALLTTGWSERLGAADNRRALLLKLSAGLSLAAASPTITGMTEPTDAPANQPQFDGIWHSRYLYQSTGRNAEFAGEHFVVIRQHDNRLVAQGLQHTSGSRLRIELAVEPPIATGSWRETTSPHGYYRGATYHGTAQFVIDPSNRRMQGMWIGFGRDFTINSGQWVLTKEDGSTTATTQRHYHNKL